MIRKVLFSPIGTTDPITGQRDGSMLHICRIYKPDIVYLYLSKEMLDYHIKDNRYLYCIKKLGEDINHKFDIKTIVREELTEVQVFDYFYDDFESELKKIRDTHDGELLLNVSSGTPAMKSALQLIAALKHFDAIPIQVTTPNKEANQKQKAYDPVMHYDCNLDKEDFEEGEVINRASISKTESLISKIQEEIIIKNIESYDYNAALTVAKSIENEFHKDTRSLLEAACCRIQLNKSGMDLALKDTHFKIDIPIKDSDKRDIFEYLLWLKIKVDRKEYSDFLRGITPIVQKLFDLCLKNNCNIDIHKYCIKKHEAEYLTREKLNVNKELLNILDEVCIRKNGEQYKSTFLGSNQMNMIIQEKCTDSKLANDIENLRKIEKQVRNTAAHKIVSVTEEWIKKEATYTPLQIFNIMKSITIKVGIKVKEEQWNSYDTMNEIIKYSIDNKE